LRVTIGFLLLRLLLMNGCRRFFAWVFAVVLSASALAHDAGLSSAQVSNSPSGVEVTLTFSWSELGLLIPDTDLMQRPEGTALTSLGPDLAKGGNGLVRAVIDGTVQPMIVPTVSTGAPATDEVVLAFAWKQTATRQLRLDFPFLPKMPFGHRVAVTWNDPGNVVALLDEHDAFWEVTIAPVETGAAAAPAMQPTNARSRPGWPSFVLLGIEHILSGFDHLCFLLALLLMTLRLREVLAVVTTFTVAHSLTLAAAATGLVSLSPRIVEPLIAASIVFIAVENLVLRRPPKYRLAVVFGFGLVHGLGFASALSERLPGATGFAVIPPLLGFNAGVELGQLAVAACLVPLIRLARTRPTFVPRWQPAASLAIAVAGAVWFWQRV
jgi:hydrogenase/urease accessory protein HupE